MSLALRDAARRRVTMRDDARRRVRRQFGSGVHLEDRLLPFGARIVVLQRPASLVDIAVGRLAYPRCTGYCFLRTIRPSCPLQMFMAAPWFSNVLGF